MISLVLRIGIPVQDGYMQLRGISSDKAIGFGPNKVHSVPDAIAPLGLREREKTGIQEELIPEAVLDTGNAADVAMGWRPRRSRAAAVAHPGLR